MTKHVVVTGGAGFIGSAMVAKLIAEGMKPVILDKLTYAGHKENLDDIPKDAYELVVGDIGDQVLVDKLLEEFQPEAVLHLAAESHVDNSITGPQEFIQTNVVGNFLLLQSVLKYYQNLDNPRKRTFRFIQVSTDEVYGSLGEVGHFTENSQIQPNSPYSASKAAGDHLARAWHHTFGLPVITTHCSNNYGPRQFPEKLIPVMIHNALEGKKLPIYGNGSNIRDWIYVDDHCQGIWLALTKGKIGEVYNFGGRAEFDNLSLVTKLCHLLDQLHPQPNGKPYEEQIGYVLDRLGHDQRYAIDDSKAEQELGFIRSVTFDQGLRNTVQWYLQNQQWCKQVQKVA